MALGLRCIVFDFDGTLADSFSQAHQIINQLAERHGFRPVHDHEVEQMRRLPATAFLAELGVSRLRMPLLALQARHELRSHMDAIDPIKGVPEMLERLGEQGLRLGVLTSNSRENVDHFLKRHNLLKHIEFVYCSRDIFSKSRRVKALMRKYHLDANHLAYIGDSDTDIAAAQHAGVPVAGVTWGYQAREVLEKHAPTWLVDSPAELTEALLEAR